MPDPSSNIRVIAGDLELAGSSAFIAFADRETSVRLSYGDEELTFLLKFVDTEGGKDASQSFEQVNNQTLRIVFTDFKNQLGAFPAEPFQVGTIAGRSLWVLYRVDHLQATKLKYVTVTFYIGSQQHGSD